MFTPKALRLRFCEVQGFSWDTPGGASLWGGPPVAVLHPYIDISVFSTSSLIHSSTSLRDIEYPVLTAIGTILTLRTHRLCTSTGVLHFRHAVAWLCACI